MTEYPVARKKTIDRIPCPYHTMAHREHETPHNKNDNSAFAEAFA
jgi:hypothetical protein